jgi:YbbR domain-containing protein
MPEGTHKIPIDDDNIATPADIKVEKIDPELVTVRLRAEVNLDLPVEVQTFNRPPAGLAVASITTTPATVRVRLWRSQALATRSVFTEPVDLSQLTETTTLSKPLSLPAEPGRVMVKIEIVPTPK